MEDIHFRIIVRSSDGTEHGFDLSEGDTTFGRDPDNKIVLNDPQVSRHHGKFVVANGELRIVDLGSRNPILLTGVQPIHRGTWPRPLEAGDFLTVGGLTLTVREIGSGPAVLARAQRVFQEAGLPCPPVPEHLAPRLVIHGPWFFATRDVPYLYGAPALLLQELEQNPSIEDYVVLGHGGHGANSHSLNYVLVLRTLAVFLEVAWGGVYMDAALCSAAFREAVEALNGLLVARAPGPPQPAASGRVVVWASDLRFETNWWSAAGPDISRQPVAQPSVAAVLEAALDWVRRSTTY